jgi:chorismate dehydratase
MSGPRREIGMAAEPLRLGKVAYLNCEPVYAGLEDGSTPARCTIVEETPAVLNEALMGGRLEVSVISSLAYARAPRALRLLPGLAIACDGPVVSVRCFSRVPWQDLTGRRVLLAPASLTSACLLRVLLRRRFGVEPEYVPAADGEDLPADMAAGLLIGDPALREASRGRFPFDLDLGEEWKAWTGLPFVFAVWAVREQVWQERAEEVRALHRALTASRTYGLARAEAISRAVHARVGMTEEACLAYFRKHLSFDLSLRHLEGLRAFFTLPEVRAHVGWGVPLRFID